MPSLRLDLAERSYEITVLHGGLKRVAGLILPRLSPSLAILVTDEHVVPHAHALSSSLQANGWRTDTIAMASY